MTAQPDAEQLAALHARCFSAAPRPWAAREFIDLLGTRGTFLLERPGAFLLGRALAGEAELLTLAVAPEARRAGLGRVMTVDFADAACRRGAQTAFLEVSALNPAARALYAGCGWQEAGLRRGYYAPGVDAIVMRLPLRPVQEGS